MKVVSIAIREYRQRVLGNKVLRTLFAPNKDIPEEWNELLNVEVHN
jgi:hypothetical protein